MPALVADPTKQATWRRTSCGVSPIAKKKTKAEQRRKLKVGVDIPTPAEVKAIVGKLEGRWRPLILTTLFTGFRGECTVPLPPILVNVSREVETRLPEGPTWAR